MQGSGNLHKNNNEFQHNDHNSQCSDHDRECNCCTELRNIKIRYSGIFIGPMFLIFDNVIKALRDRYYIETEQPDTVAN